MWRKELSSTFARCYLLVEFWLRGWNQLFKHGMQISILIYSKYILIMTVLGCDNPAIWFPLAAGYDISNVIFCLEPNLVALDPVTLPSV